MAVAVRCCVAIDRMCNDAARKCYEARNSVPQQLSALLQAVRAWHAMRMHANSRYGEDIARASVLHERFCALTGLATSAYAASADISFINSTSDIPTRPSRCRVRRT